MEEAEQHEPDSLSPNIFELFDPVDTPEFRQYASLGGLIEFWEQSREWLSARGIELYRSERYPESNKILYHGWFARPASAAAPLPYAHCMDNEIDSSTCFSITPVLAPAQDFLGRDIMLRLVQNDCAQYQVVQTLFDCGAVYSDPMTFPCVVPPLTLLDTPYHYSIYTMPMWGGRPSIEGFRTIGGVLRFMQCLLRGLTFLHEHRIAHRDIFEPNIVVNCYRPDQNRDRLREDLREYHEGRDVFYALVDYDQSIQLPPNVSLKHCRRPAEESWVGADSFKPDDTCFGRPTYNPFAYDVAMLGNLFRIYFTASGLLDNAVPSLPALPALFDKMTTYALSDRFTAEEAQHFLLNEVMQVPKTTLKTAVSLSCDYENMFDADNYWLRLTPELQDKWRSYRTPPLPLSTRILNWFILKPGFAKVILFIRRMLQT